MSNKSYPHIEDFTLSSMENNRIDVSYYDNNIGGHVEISLKASIIANWIELKGYNWLTYDSSDRFGEHVQDTIKCDSMDFCIIHLEEKHVLEYLKEKGVIK